MEKVFYNATLPRSGSTLLQNLLAQNPDIYASPTSGLVELIQAAKIPYTDKAEFAALDSQLMKKCFLSYCKGGIEGYCSAVSDKKYVVDKSFSWGREFNLLTMMNNQKPKMIIMVRDLREVFASMEEGYRNSPDKANPNVNWSTLANTTLEKRITNWAMSSPLGSSIDAIMELIVQKVDKDVFFLRYEHLCISPKEVMSSLYAYLEIPYFEHNFNDIQQLTDQNDNMYMFSHKIKPQLKAVPIKSHTVLGQEACNWIYNTYEWFFRYFKYSK